MLRGFAKSRFDLHFLIRARCFRSRLAFSLLELLVVLAIIATLLGLLLPAIQKVRERALQSTCGNHLKQIGLALVQYHDVAGTLPAGCSVQGGQAPQLHLAWCARLLPYLEQAQLWHTTLQAFQTAPFFEDEPHIGLGTHIPTFVCPSDPLAQTPFSFGTFSVAFTNYLGVAGETQAQANGLLYLDSRVQFSDITDGTSHTLLVGERALNRRRQFGWWYAGWGQNQDGAAEMHLSVREAAVYPRLRACPADANTYRAGHPQALCDLLHFWSYHSAGAHFLTADGAVHLLTYSAHPLLPALASRAGGEAVELP
jgi:prepilin-type N-terminal cleavage/methylation domain-containing protein